MLKKILSFVVLLLFIALIYLFLTWPKNGAKVMQTLSNLESYLQQAFGEKVTLPTILTGKKKGDDSGVMDAESDTATISEVVQESVPAAAPEPEPMMPATPAAVKTTLPTLSESDPRIVEELQRAKVPKALLDQLRLSAIIQRFVIVVDSLTKKSLPAKYRLTSPPKGSFLVKGDDAAGYQIDSRNFTRYEPFIELLESVDSRKLVLIYQRFYPLFQEAYAELGQTNRLFQNRLLEVIEHLLSAPEFYGNIKLTRPGVFYKFADKDLESESSGRKLLIRMGEKNTIRIKAKLREIKRELILTM